MWNILENLLIMSISLHISRISWTLCKSVVVVEGTANPHPQETEVGNKRPNSYKIGSIWGWRLRMCPHNSKTKEKSQQGAGWTWWQEAQLRAPCWWCYIALGSASLKPYWVSWSYGKQVKVLFFRISHLFYLFLLNFEIIPWLTLPALLRILIGFFSSSI